MWLLHVHRCRVYSNLPKPYCYLIQDPSDACCQTPKCDFTASTNIHSGSYSAVVTVTQRPTTTPRPTTPKPSECFWDSIHSMLICWILFFLTIYILWRFDLGIIITKSIQITKIEYLYPFIQHQRRKWFIKYLNKLQELFSTFIWKVFVQVCCAKLILLFE